MNTPKQTIRKLVEEVVKEIRAWPPLGVGSYHRTSTGEVDQEDPLPKEILTIAPEMPMPTEGHCGCGHEPARIKVRMKKVIKEFQPVGGSYGLSADDIVNKSAPAGGGSPQCREVGSHVTGLTEKKNKNKKKGLLDQPDFKSKVAWVKKNKPKVKDPEAYVAETLRKTGELKESAQEYVWGVKGPQRVGNKFGGWVPIKVKKKSKK